MSSEHCFRCVPLHILLLLSRYSATSILSPPLTQELFNEKIFFISKLGFFLLVLLCILSFYCTVGENVDCVMSAVWSLLSFFLHA